MTQHEESLSRWILSGTNKRFGGQGAVQKVKCSKSGVTGGLKTLHSHNRSTERFARFSREVELLRTLTVDGVPDLLDSATDVPEPFFVMQWIEGQTLSQISNGNRIDLHNAVGYARSLTEIIDRCHQSGVIHRDVKPDNILIDAKQRLWLVDFGIAWTQGTDSFETKAGQEMGNRFLRLPENAPGEISRDPRSDVTCAVGVLFYLLTGVPPRQLLNHRGEKPHQSNNWLAAQRANPSWQTFFDIFEIGFEFKTDDRFQNASDLIEALNAVNGLNPSQSITENRDRPIRVRLQALTEESQMVQLERGRALLDLIRTLLNGRLDRVSIDSIEQGFREAARTIYFEHYHNASSDDRAVAVEAFERLVDRTVRAQQS